MNATHDGTLNFRLPFAQKNRARGVSWFAGPRGRAPVDLRGQSDSFARPMITVTDNAVKQLRALLDAQPAAEERGLRIQIAKGGCSGLSYEMSLDRQKSGDAIVQHDGVAFLVDEESADYLRGATLDYHDGLTGAGFHVVNPNAARTCGCGTSFEPARSA